MMDECYNIRTIQQEKVKIDQGDYWKFLREYGKS